MNKTAIIVVLISIIGVLVTIIVKGPSADQVVSNNDETQKSNTSSSENLEADKKIDPAIEELVACLRDSGVTIYGSVTCPYCNQLAQSFGGYDVIDSIYVECSKEPDRCKDEMLGRGVPEIQINGEMYQGPRNPRDIGKAASCEMVS